MTLISEAYAPILVEAYTQKGLILSTMGTQEREEALVCLTKAVDLDPTQAKAKEKIKALKFDRGELSPESFRFIEDSDVWKPPIK